MVPAMKRNHCQLGLVGCMLKVFKKCTKLKPMKNEQCFQLHFRTVQFQFQFWKKCFRTVELSLYLTVCGSLCSDIYCIWCGWGWFCRIWIGLCEWLFDLSACGSLMFLYVNLSERLSIRLDHILHNKNSATIYLCASKPNHWHLPFIIIFSWKEHFKSSRNPINVKQTINPSTIQSQLEETPSRRRSSRKIQTLPSKFIGCAKNIFHIFIWLF